MLKRKIMFVGFFAFCLLATVFIGVAGLLPYDPWCDVTDDGIIDIEDLTQVSLRLWEEGTPFVTKAGLEYDSEWLNITDKCGQYFNITHNLNTTDIMVDIQGKTTMDGGVHQRHLGLTGYTPGWSRTFGGTNDEEPARSMVYTGDGGYALAGYTTSFGAGGYDLWLVKTGVESGLAWTDSTDNTITLYRGATDPYWNYVRVRIWKICEDL